MPICKWEDEPEVKPTQDPRRHTPFALKEGDKVKKLSAVKPEDAKKEEE
jgi:hypothetical protein